VFGFLFGKGLLLQLLCIWEPWKICLSPGKVLFLKKGTNLICWCLKSVSQTESSSSSSSSEDEDDEQYHDGWDDNLMGDEADRERLEKMTEKEREQEIFNRVEKREALKTRFEIERKLRLAKRKEKKKKREKEKANLEKEGIALRKKERKRHIEEKKAKALDDLKAKRSEKKEKKVAESMAEQKEPQLKASDVFTDDEDDDEQEESKSSSGEGSYRESEDE